MKLGFHNSIEGGLHRAVEEAVQLGTECLQIFLHSPRSWSLKPVSEYDKELFKEKVTRYSICPVFAHASYLINLASSEKKLWHASVNLLIRELKMAEELGIKGVVVHPGRTKGAPAKEAKKRVKEALQKISSEIGLQQLIIENTAGQHGELGSSIEELLEITQGFERQLLGVCLDTAHAFSSGIDITEESVLKTIINSIDIPIVVVHLNDSKVSFGSRIDRHEHIGKGHIGVEGFKSILKVLKETSLPLIMETPKKLPTDDIMNLLTVRNLLTEL